MVRSPDSGSWANTICSYSSPSAAKMLIGSEFYSPEQECGRPVKKPASSRGRGRGVMTKTRFARLRLLVAVLAVLAVSVPAGAFQQSAQRYIVRLQPGADVDATARRLGTSTGGSVLYTYHHVFGGFAIAMSP